MAENRHPRERTPEWRAAATLREPSNWISQDHRSALVADLMDAADIVSELAEDLRQMHQDTAISLDTWPAARRLCDLIPAVSA